MFYGKKTDDFVENYLLSTSHLFLKNKVFNGKVFLQKIQLYIQQ